MAIVEGVLGAEHALGKVYAVTVTPDDRYAISGGHDTILRKHDLASGVEVCTQQNVHSKGVTMAKCANNGEFVVVCVRAVTAISSSRCGRRITSS